MNYNPKPDILYLSERIDKLEASMKAIVKALQLFLESTNYIGGEKNDTETFRFEQPRKES